MAGVVGIALANGAAPSDESSDLARAREQLVMSAVTANSTQTRAFPICTVLGGLGVRGDLPVGR